MKQRGALAVAIGLMVMVVGIFVAFIAGIYFSNQYSDFGQFDWPVVFAILYSTGVISFWEYKKL